MSVLYKPYFLVFSLDKFFLNPTKKFRLQMNAFTSAKTMNKTADSKWRIQNGGFKMADSKWRIQNGGLKVVDSKCQTRNGGLKNGEPQILEKPMAINTENH